MDCVEVCPVDCFYEGENMLVIHPDECIDCGVCEPECPVDAIKPDTEPMATLTPAWGKPILWLGACPGTPSRFSLSFLPKHARRKSCSLNSPLESSLRRWLMGSF